MLRRSSLVKIQLNNVICSCRILYIGIENHLLWELLLPVFGSHPSVVSQSQSHNILVSFNQNAYYCWKDLWGLPVTHCRGCVLGLRSCPLSLFCSLCRPCFLYSVRLAHCAFHLLFASSCHKLTVDVHTWPALGYSIAWIDGCSAGVGRVLTACQSRLWRLALHSSVQWPVWGDLL